MNGLFDNNGSMLAAAWTERKDTLATLKFQPYADLLLDEVVWPDVVSRKDDIFGTLMEKCKTATETYELTVPIWSFNTCFDKRYKHFIEAPAHYHLLYAGNKDALRVQWVYDNGWNHLMEIASVDTTPGLPQVQIYHVVKKTDFLGQISIRFGYDYRVTLDQTCLQETSPEAEEITRSVYTLNLHYYPNGLPEHHEKQKEALRANIRERRQLRDTERLIFWNGSRIIKKPKPSSYNYCDYGCDNEESE